MHDRKAQETEHIIAIYIIGLVVIDDENLYNFTGEYYKLLGE